MLFASGSWCERYSEDQGDLQAYGQMIEEVLDLFLLVTKVGPAAHFVREQKALYPCAAASLCAYGLVSTAHRLSHLIEQMLAIGASGFREARRIIDKYCISSTGKFP